ncbi:amino acid ABC transporter [Neokomagataea thailandica NBRC 106555]|uniref:Amino acid permease n=2 Tax=Neokomagataea TaxID=1223423 RepID=A0A4Y6VAK2_9PROT|nr:MULTISPECIES: amino acid permease [Neokomagataea]QDH25385.1 amino acid permease [Neokomagataea tanensis]GBR53500.1 amino acid ABC transporter [Neokomagataea thailandica NBRC 106555]
MQQDGQLAQSLRTRHVIMIALGGVIGAGFFIGSSAALSLAGPMVLLSYVLCGLFVYVTNLMMRDLAFAVPGRHSFLGQIRQALGPRMAFVAGWTYLITWIIVLAVEAIAITNMLAPYVPVPYVVLELAIIGLMTGINLLSVKGYGEFEYWFSTVKIVALVSFIAIGAWLVGTHPANNIQHNLMDHGGLLPHGPLALLAVLPTILFSMGGSEIATIAAVETEDAQENIARAARTIPMRIGVFYLLTIGLILCLVPWSDVVPGQSPFLLVLNRFHVPFAFSALFVVILTAAVSTLNSGIYATSRILFEMAEGGSAPAIFLKIDEKTKLPRRALLTCVGVAVLIAVTAIISPDKIFALLVSLTGGFMLVYNAVIILARLKVVEQGRWVCYFGLAVIGCVLVAMALQMETRSQIGIGFGALLLILLADRVRSRFSSRS